MSDPVTNVEIEDVLSSIRRLVSNESKGPVPHSRNDPTPAPREPDKLVLAPSFRVDEAAPNDFAGSAPVVDLRDHTPQDEAASQAADAQQGVAEAAEDYRDNVHRDEDHGDDNHWDDGKTPEFRHSSEGVRDAKEAEDDGWSTADPAPHPAADDRPTQQAQAWKDGRSEDQTENVDEDEAGQADSAEIEQDRPDQPEQESLKARVAELEQVVASRDDQWEPDGNSDDAYSGSAIESLPWEDYSPDDETGSAEPKTASDESSDGDTDADEPATKSEAKPAVSIPQDDIPDNFVAEEEEPISSRDRDTEQDDVLTASDDFLDEDALRDLVADIVRQELQGALGERITRNVRKLVRREIHRALASQDLE